MRMNWPSSVAHVRYRPTFDARCACSKQNAGKTCHGPCLCSKITSTKQDAHQKRRAGQIVPAIGGALNRQNARRIRTIGAPSDSAAPRAPHGEVSYLRSTRKTPFFKDVRHQMTRFGTAK